VMVRESRRMLRRWIGILSLWPFLAFSFLACSTLQSSGSGTSPSITAGKKIPDLAFLDTQGNQIQLYPLLQRANRTVLVFYRGYWCSYCQEQFVGLRAELSEFKEQGTQVIGVSVDEPDLMAEFGRNVEKQYWYGTRKETKKSPEGPVSDSPFLLLSDPSREGIQKLGIAENHPRFGLVARPTTILLDKEGQVLWLYLGKTPDDRPEPGTVLHARRWF
jgi:peroxiredoxin